MEKTDNELIEAFHVERGGIPHSESHLVFYESDPMRWMRQETYCNLLEIVCVKSCVVAFQNTQGCHGPLTSL